MNNLKKLENSWPSALNLQKFFSIEQQQVRTIFKTKYHCCKSFLLVLFSSSCCLDFQVFWIWQSLLFCDNSLQKASAQPGKLKAFSVLFFFYISSQKMSIFFGAALKTWQLFSLFFSSIFQVSVTWCNPPWGWSRH